MVVVSIGNTSAKIIISDNATPASGTYAWYIEAEFVRFLNKMPYYDKMYQSHPSGITRGIKQFMLDMGWSFQGIKITNSTDWDNLLKAFGYWEKNNSKLYLSVKNEWDSNLATIGTYAAPTTLAQQTGQLSNFIATIFAAIATCGVDFRYVNTIAEVT